MLLANKLSKFVKPIWQPMGLCLAISLTGLHATAHAESQLRLLSENDNVAVSEGYQASLETLATQTQTFRSSNQHEDWKHRDQYRPGVWVANVGMLLFNDADHDGYYAGFSLSIDVDCDYGDTDVYAKIYLQQDNGEMYLLHTTSRFTVYSLTIGDEYRVDTELRSNYYAGQYNVTIDIHDAWSDELLDTATHRGFDNLQSLPLEADSQQQSPYHNDEPTGSADVVVTEYAGLFGPWALVAFALCALRRCKSLQTPVS